MHEYGKHIVYHIPPRYDGEEHYDESPEAVADETTVKIAQVITEHAPTKEWWDHTLNTTQYLCGCRFWFYDHPIHVAKEIVAALGLKEST